MPDDVRNADGGRTIFLANSVIARSLSREWFANHIRPDSPKPGFLRMDRECKDSSCAGLADQQPQGIRAALQSGRPGGDRPLEGGMTTKIRPERLSAARGAPCA